MNKTARTLLHLAAIVAIFLLVRYFLLAPKDCSQASPQAAAEQLMTQGMDALNLAHEEATKGGQAFTCPETLFPELPESDACFSGLSVSVTPAPGGCQVTATATRTMDNQSARAQELWVAP